MTITLGVVCLHVGVSMTLLGYTSIWMRVKKNTSGEVFPSGAVFQSQFIIAIFMFGAIPGERVHFQVKSEVPDFLPDRPGESFHAVSIPLKVTHKMCQKKGLDLRE